MSKLEKLKKQLFSRPIAYRRDFGLLGVDNNRALFLSQAIYWTKRTGEDGWFYKTLKEWEDETLLTRRKMQRVRRILKSKGYLEEKLAKTPATLHWRLNIDKIAQDLQEYHDNHAGVPKKPTVSIPKQETKHESVTKINVEEPIKENIEPKQESKEPKSQKGFMEFVEETREKYKGNSFIESYPTLYLRGNERIGVTSKGYLYSKESSNDLEPLEAKKIWEYLYRHQDLSLIHI